MITGIPKASLIGLFSLMVLYTCSLAYSCATIKAEPSKYGVSFIPSESILGGMKINSDYDSLNGYKTYESGVNTVLNALFEMPFTLSDVSINVPVVFPLYSYAVSKPFSVRDKTSDWYKASEVIAEDTFGGFSGFAKKISYKYEMLAVDNSIIKELSEIHNVPHDKMRKYALGIPLAHEVGHGYFKKENYNHFNFAFDDKYTVTLSEYVAEYISFVIVYSRILTDDSIENKKGAMDVLSSLYAMSRFESSGEHAGAAMVAYMMTNNEHILVEDAKRLSRSVYPSSSLSNIAYSILNSDEKRLSKEISLMMHYEASDIKKERKARKHLFNYVKNSMEGIFHAHHVGI